jgi:hypothetical protein
MGKDLQPDYITELLKISPSYFHRRGDANVSPSGKHLGERSEGIWCLESTADPFLDIETHLLFLIQQVEGKQHVFQLLKKENFRLDILIGVFGAEETLGFSVKAEILMALGVLGLQVEFDIYTMLQ